MIFSCRRWNQETFFSATNRRCFPFSHSFTSRSCSFFHVCSAMSLLFYGSGMWRNAFSHLCAFFLVLFQLNRLPPSRRIAVWMLRSSFFLWIRRRRHRCHVIFRITVVSSWRKRANIYLYVLSFPRKRPVRCFVISKPWFDRFLIVYVLVSYPAISNQLQGKCGPDSWLLAIHWALQHPDPVTFFYFLLKLNDVWRTEEVRWWSLFLSIRYTLKRHPMEMSI